MQGNAEDFERLTHMLIKWLTIVLHLRNIRDKMLLTK